MKVTVSQPNLAQALSIVSHAVSKSSSLMILENILITTEKDSICLTATNLELGVRYHIPAQIDDEGSITIPARFFTDLVNTMPADSVTMNLDEATQTLNVRCRQLVTDIRGIEATEFPPIPEFDPEEAVTFEMPELKKIINQVAFAAAVDDNRPVLHGVKLAVNGEELSMVATDGFRIAVKKIKLMNGLDKPVSAIIPATGLRELARIAGADDKNVLMSFCGKDSSQVIFRLQNAELVSQLIAGQFIDFESIVPKAYKTRIVVSRTAFLAACNSASVYARESKNLVKLDIQHLTGEMGNIVLSTKSDQFGAQENQVECNIEGDEIAIAFNVRYLKDVLEILETPNVSIRTNASMAPALIEPADSTDDYRYVLMPMHFA